MSEAAVFAAQAAPYMTFMFTPHSEYRLTAGTFSSGQVLGTEEITNCVQLKFDGTFDESAELAPLASGRSRPALAD
ncbi:MAG TPA: hypothetical protein VFX16_03245 [Pseudonocardiaceae bacterium]|nr:hypothetical protein [Pseudonocardiaceae bacterium]